MPPSRRRTTCFPKMQYMRPGIDHAAALSMHPAFAFLPQCTPKPSLMPEVSSSIQPILLSRSVILLSNI